MSFIFVIPHSQCSSQQQEQQCCYLQSCVNPACLGCRLCLLPDFILDGLHRVRRKRSWLLRKASFLSILLNFHQLRVPAASVTVTQTPPVSPCCRSPLDTGLVLTAQSCIVHFHFPQLDQTSLIMNNALTVEPTNLQTERRRGSYREKQWKWESSPWQSSPGKAEQKAALENSNSC